ncbi:DUF1214 domain-containing protein [Tunturiibacter gelidoferens]|uniref:Uncharacterized protein n=1 Tax=Tunturiibacter gelidiferens TaxID=3069689 RepID=A0ACC5NWP8_9BACT|nr:DUF1214 domain-containing protein [Edaphobacter lichenicola]MBB5339023.1 hypothetical protein [Edaphobacter lichenicola]
MARPHPHPTTPLAWDNNIQFWQQLYNVISSEPSNPRVHYFYGELAALGIEQGKPFTSDARMTAILEKAAKIGNAQMRVESFGDNRPTASSGPIASGSGPPSASKTATSTLPTTATSTPAINGSIRPSEHRLPCSSATHCKSYKLTVPQPVTGKLFWSVTVYDTDTRSQVQTDQARTSPKPSRPNSTSVPTLPQGHENQWIKTIPGKGWFVYFRVYGPEKPPLTEAGNLATSKR